MSQTVQEAQVIEQGKTITDDTYFVCYADHPNGSPAGYFSRAGLEVAERAASRMLECGYRFSEVRHAASLFEMCGLLGGAK